MDLLTREAQLEDVQVDVDARTVTARLCRWMDPRTVADPGGQVYREQHAPGSLHLAPDVHVADRHHGDIIGRAVDLTETPDGPVLELRVAPTRAGLDALALVDAGVTRSVSMEFAPDPAGAIVEDDLVTRTASTLYGLAFAFRPAHDAPILTTREEEPPMTDVMPDTPTLPNGSAPELLTRSDLDDLAAQVAVIAERPAPPGPGSHPAAGYRDLGEYLLACREDPEVPRLVFRALADQITTNNPGVLPPQWMSSVFGVVDLGRPAVTAFGVMDAGTSGMEINWPYYDGDIKTLVAAQTAEKTAVLSVRVDIKKGTQALETYAGGSDISYQLLRRSSPSYREQYGNIMMAGYAAVTDTAMVAAMVAGSTNAVDLPPLTATADTLRAALFQASAMVQAATGSPASFALAATDVFVKVGGLPGLWPAPYGTTNAAGTADAASLSVNVSGLPVIHDPYAAAGTLLVSNSQAAAWFEDGPFVVAAEDVEKLGQNVAVWGMGTPAVFVPKGIVRIYDVP